MKFYTSYFYQVRHFHPNTIGFSTAIYDPKWFYSPNGPFIDSHGVVNGLRAAALAPGINCAGLCGGPTSCATKDPSTCEFLKRYKLQLEKLNFDAVIQYLEYAAERMAELTGTDKEPEIVLLFYEKSDNPCSERTVLTQWFKDHNFPISEWSKI